MNRNAFYDYLRKSSTKVFGNSLSSRQVAGTERFLDATKDLDLPKRAYILASVYHETAHTMTPIREAKGKTDDQTIARLDRAWNRGQLTWVSKPYWRRDANGRAWFGRGDIQLTHRDNYVKAEDKLGIDLTSDPNKVLQQKISTQIAVRGMLEGWFTGKKLGDYLTDGEKDFKGARRIVNGQDRAADIAGYASYFLGALEAGAGSEVARDVDLPETVEASAPRLLRTTDMISSRRDKILLKVKTKRSLIQRLMQRFRRRKKR